MHAHKAKTLDSENSISRFQGIYKTVLLVGALGVIRTHGPLLRKQMLYPLSYEGKWDYFNIFSGVGQPRSRSENMYLYVTR